MISYFICYIIFKNKMLQVESNKTSCAENDWKDTPINDTSSVCYCNITKDDKNVTFKSINETITGLS